MCWLAETAVCGSTCRSTMTNYDSELTNLYSLLDAVCLAAKQQIPIL